VEGKQLKISIERENIHHVNNNHKVKRIYTSQMRVECKMKRNVTGKGHENGLRISMKEIINIKWWQIECWISNVGISVRYSPVNHQDGTFGWRRFCHFCKFVKHLEIPCRWSWDQMVKTFTCIPMSPRRLREHSSSASPFLLRNFYHKRHIEDVNWIRFLTYGIWAIYYVFKPSLILTNEELSEGRIAQSMQ